MATKWTPEVIARETARKQAANIPLNYGKTTPTTAPKQTPAPSYKPPSAQQATPKVATPPVYNATNSTTPPSLGYGGATYGSSGAANRAISANQSAIRNNAGFRDSEIARTQAVIAARQAQGLDTSGQEKYLRVNLGYADPQPVVEQPVTPQGSGWNLSRSDIEQEADYQLGRDRADLENATNRQSQTVRNNADYAARLLRDNRVLQDVQTNATLNPFSGKTAWDKGLIGRQRAIDDTYLSAELTNQLNAISQDLYNFDKLAPDRRRMLINEMTRIEREFNLQEGALLGMYRMGGSGNSSGGNGSAQSFVPTLAARELSWKQATDQRDFDYQVGRDTIEDKQWQTEFDRRVKEDGLQRAIAWYNATTSRNSSNNAAGNANFNKLMDVWRGTGKAPKGLEGYGIQPGTPYAPGADSNGGKPVPYDQTPEWASEIAEINAGDTTYEYILQNSTQYIADYTYDGYAKLLAAAKARLDD